MTTREQDQADRMIRDISPLHRYRVLVWLGFMGFGLMSLWALIECVVGVTHYLGRVL